MVRNATSATVFQDSAGMRLSATYSEIDEETGRIISDNKRVDRILTTKEQKAAANKMLAIAQDFIDQLEE